MIKMIDNNLVLKIKLLHHRWNFNLIINIILIILIIKEINYLIIIKQFNFIINKIIIVQIESIAIWIYQIIIISNK
jgi:hypothetical protein